MQLKPPAEAWTVWKEILHGEQEGTGMGHESLHCTQQKYFPSCIGIIHLATSSWAHVNRQEQILSLGV